MHLSTLYYQDWPLHGTRDFAIYRWLPLFLLCRTQSYDDYLQISVVGQVKKKRKKRNVKYSKTCRTWLDRLKDLSIILLEYQHKRRTHNKIFHVAIRFHDQNKIICSFLVDKNAIPCYSNSFLSFHHFPLLLPHFFLLSQHLNGCQLL